MSDIPDIAQCRVTASYQNDKATAEGEILTIKPTTVSLSFMRYISAKENRKSFFVWPQRETPTQYTVEDVPLIDGWSYRPTILREGYLYVYYENNPDFFKEFKVGIGGNLTNIVSDLSEDVRLPNEGRSRKYLCISVDDIVWIAFSEYQLSAG